MHRYSRRAAKVDANQKVIVDSLNEFPGVSALSIGKPLDVLVGVAGRYYADGEPRTFVIEIKNKLGKAARTEVMTKAQREFFETWQGQKAVCFTLLDVLTACGLRVEGGELFHWLQEPPPK